MNALCASLGIRIPILQAPTGSVAGPELAAAVAAELVDVTRATTKFHNFLREFLPSHPPERRPPEPWQHRWSKTALSESLDLVYTYRSNALHEGTQFPAPMCCTDRCPDGTYSEVGTLYAAGTSFHVWRREKAPINLHVFEHIVRGAILNWWASLESA